MSNQRKSLLHLGLLAMAVALAVAGCSSQEPPSEPAPAPAPAPTVTVTETPSPIPRVAADSLTPIDAWLACSAVARFGYDWMQQVSDTEWSPYEPDRVSDNGDGTFDVEVAGMPSGSLHGILGKCTIGGTVASPELVSFGFIGLG